MYSLQYRFLPYPVDMETHLATAARAHEEHSPPARPPGGAASKVEPPQRRHMPRTEGPSALSRARAPRARKPGAPTQRRTPQRAPIRAQAAVHPPRPETEAGCGRRLRKPPGPPEPEQGAWPASVARPPCDSSGTGKRCPPPLAPTGEAPLTAAALPTPGAREGSCPPGAKSNGSAHEPPTSAAQ